MLYPLSYGSDANNRHRERTSVTYTCHLLT
jgi:hypothetical protein